MFCLRNPLAIVLTILLLFPAASFAQSEQTFAHIVLERFESHDDDDPLSADEPYLIVVGFRFRLEWASGSGEDDLLVRDPDVWLVTGEHNNLGESGDDWAKEDDEYRRLPEEFWPAVSGRAVQPGTVLGAYVAHFEEDADSNEEDAKKFVRRLRSTFERAAERGLSSEERADSGSSGVFEDVAGFVADLISVPIGVVVGETVATVSDPDDHGGAYIVVTLATGEFAPAPLYFFEATPTSENMRDLVESLEDAIERLDWISQVQERIRGPEGTREVPPDVRQAFRDEFGDTLLATSLEPVRIAQPFSWRFPVTSMVEHQPRSAEFAGDHQIDGSVRVVQTSEDGSAFDATIAEAEPSTGTSGASSALRATDRVTDRDWSWMTRLPGRWSLSYGTEFGHLYLFPLPGKANHPFSENPPSTSDQFLGMFYPLTSKGKLDDRRQRIVRLRQLDEQGITIELQDIYQPIGERDADVLTLYRPFKDPTGADVMAGYLTYTDAALPGDLEGSKSVAGAYARRGGFITKPRYGESFRDGLKAKQFPGRWEYVEKGKRRVFEVRRHPQGLYVSHLPEEIINEFVAWSVKFDGEADNNYLLRYRQWPHSLALIKHVDNFEKTLRWHGWPGRQEPIMALNCEPMVFTGEVAGRGFYLRQVERNKPPEPIDESLTNNPYEAFDEFDESPPVLRGKVLARGADAWKGVVNAQVTISPVDNRPEGDARVGTGDQGRFFATLRKGAWRVVARKGDRQSRSTTVRLDDGEAHIELRLTEPAIRLSDKPTATPPTLAPREREPSKAGRQPEVPEPPHKFAGPQPASPKPDPHGAGPQPEPPHPIPVLQMKAFAAGEELERLANAQITLMKDGELYLSATTDDDGSYTQQLEQGTYELVVSKEGFEPVQTILVAKADTVTHDVYLTKGKTAVPATEPETVEFTVVTRNAKSGNPIPGVDIVWRGEDGELERGRTNEFGMFQQQVDEPGQYTVAASKDGFESAGDRFDVEQDSENRFVLRLDSVAPGDSPRPEAEQPREPIVIDKPRVDVTTYVVYRDGDRVVGVPRASVTWTEVDSAKTRARTLINYFHYLDIDDNDRLRTSGKEAYGVFRGDDAWDLNDDGYFDEKEFISGVRFADSKPFVQSTRSGSRGVMRLQDVPLGRYTIRVDAPSGYRDTTVDSYLVSRGAKYKYIYLERLETEPEPPSTGLVTIQVEDAEGEPMRPGRIGVRRVGERGSQRMDRRLGTGLYEVELDPGRYEVVASREGYRARTPEVKVVGGGKLRGVVTLTPEPGEPREVPLYVRVLDERGRLITDARVTVAAGPDLLPVRRMRDGLYRAQAGPGTYKVNAFKEGYQSGSAQRVTIAQSDRGETVNVRLTRESTPRPTKPYIAVRVIDDGGRPIDGAAVTVTQGNNRAMVVPGGNGGYLARVHAGAWNVSASKSGYLASGVQKVTLGRGEKAERVTLRLARRPSGSDTPPGKARLTVRVLDQKGRQVSGARVEIMTARSGKFTRTTGDSGSITAPTAAGTYTVKVSKNGYSSETARVTVGSRNVTETVRLKPSLR